MVTRRKTRTAWPDAVALREILQTPSVALTAALDLHRATVATDRAGLPLVYTGRFAAVFRLQLPGNIPVALRVFTSPDITISGERRIRAERTTAALERLAPEIGDLLPAPRYLPQAVLLEDAWFPAQILPWADGVPLLSFIEAHYKNADTLRQLAATIEDAILRLERAGTAHGDLHHDNLLVADGGRRLTLIDYDGLYAPELADLPPAERGHPNYQHPARTAAHYGPGMDRFAAATLVAGLLLLAEQPSLWDENGGEANEAVLFTATDLAAPEVSPLFAVADEKAATSPTLAEAIQRLQSLCRASAPPLLPATSSVIHETVPPLPDRWPSRVSPTCDEERVRPVSYLAPLRGSAAAAHDLANLFALRGYLALALPLMLAMLAEAWTMGGAKWPFLAYLSAICVVLGFIALYLTWPVKRQRDALELEMGQLREAERQAEQTRALLQHRLDALAANPPVPPEPRAERLYIETALAQVPLGRAIGGAGVAPQTVRFLRDAGVETAAHLWRRHGFLPQGTDPAQAALLKAWVREGEAHHRARFHQETCPWRALTQRQERLAADSAVRTARLDALAEMARRFPDASLGAFLRRLWMPGPQCEGITACCGE